MIYIYIIKIHFQILPQKYMGREYIYSIYIQPQIRKSWDSMENANKKRK